MFTFILNPMETVILIIAALMLGGISLGAWAGLRRERNPRYKRR